MIFHLTIDQLKKKIRVVLKACLCRVEPQYSTKGRCLYHWPTVIYKQLKLKQKSFCQFHCIIPDIVTFNVSYCQFQPNFQSLIVVKLKTCADHHTCFIQMRLLCTSFEGIRIICQFIKYQPLSILVRREQEILCQ